MRRSLLVAGVVGASLAVAAAGVLSLVGLLSDQPEPSEPDAAAAAPALQQDDPGYRVWARQDDGAPVRWDPCEPIRWVLDAEQGPGDARQLVSAAIARIERASGLRFSYEGRTGEAPTADRPLTDDGDWAPVLISWTPGGSTDLPLGDRQRGVAVPVAVDGDEGERAFVTGQIALNSDIQLLPGFEDRHASWGATVLHELAHLVGLDHVDDPEQLLHPTPGFGPVELGGGDLAGLAAVGADGGCVDVPDAAERGIRLER